MRPGTANFLIATAFAVLLALAIATVALGVITALKMPPRDDLPNHGASNPEPDQREPSRGITT